MSSDSTRKAGQELVARSERGRFAAGGSSANPKGRPKRGESLAEQWRRSTDWEAIRARLERIATGEKSKDTDVVAAARELADRSWGKPLSSHELKVTQGDSGPSNGDRLAAALTDEELALLEAAHRRIARTSDEESSEIVEQIVEGSNDDAA